MIPSICVVDLGYGDSGKGSITDFWVRRNNSKLVVRYNGGPQASHHVVLPDGRSHGFSQFGSGTFAGACTFLSHFMMVEPYALENEAIELETRHNQNKVRERVLISYGCPIITPWHWRLNRVRESLRDVKHGTCGMGIGELRSDMLAESPVFRVLDVESDDAEKILLGIRESKIHEAWIVGGDAAADYVAADKYSHTSVLKDYRQILSRFLCRWVVNIENAVYEGAQGVLLDEQHGWQPHTTWSDCTQRQALALAAGKSAVNVIGILPLIPSRHGAGPFVTETTDWTRTPPSCGYPGMKQQRSNDHNQHNKWQGAFRVGHFDAIAAHYALSVTKIKKVALTFADQWTGVVCVGYMSPEHRIYTSILDEAIGFRIIDSSAIMATMKPIYSSGCTIADLEKMLNAEIVMTSSGPTHLDKEFLA